jgi:putative SOS response-associated peptidase YedK
MCGRFTLIASADIIRQRFDVKVAELQKRYNIAPTQKIAIILDKEPEKLQLAEWGIGRMINTRSDSLEKGKFKSLKRCLIPADGFYEWKSSLPFYYTLKDKSVFAFAGVYEDKKDGIRASIVTTEANSLVRKVHDRMPAMLERKEEKTWLRKERVLLSPFPEERMDVISISRQVNDPGHESDDIMTKQKTLG